jgi:triacylglycerol esterase/lipase EstA (alpha/beta hydrolase family)
MGGLVARAALRCARPGLIGRIVTLGAPHHGTALACWFRWPNARQMCPRSRWLTQLNACEEGRLQIPITTLYSLDDSYIVPAGSARLEGARPVELQGIGHLALLNSKVVLEQVVSELLE